MKQLIYVIALVVINNSFAQNATFNKEETLKLLAKGNSTIKGEAFAKDNRAPIKGLAIININKKQLAPKGTEVLLIPYTDFFKNWFEYNKKAAKKKEEPLPLPEGASDCFVRTKVIDKKGNFEFTNLKGGSYFLISEFGFIRTKSTTRTEGYTHTYINGNYIGSAPIERIYHYNESDWAFATKVVEIKNDGETVKVKLRDTESLF